MSWSEEEINELKEILPSTRIATYKTSDGIEIKAYVDYIIFRKEGESRFYLTFNNKIITYNEFKRMASMKAFW